MERELLAIFSLVALRRENASCLYHTVTVSTVAIATYIRAGLRATRVKTGLGCLHGEGWENTMRIYGGCLRL